MIKSLLFLIVVLMMVTQTICKSESSDVSHGNENIIQIGMEDMAAATEDLVVVSEAMEEDLVVASEVVMEDGEEDGDQE
jgi:hypothetical protein